MNGNAVQVHSAAAPTLSSMIKESADPKVQQIRKEIEEVKKQRSGTMSRMRDLQHKLSYKMAEQEAISKLFDMEKSKPRKENIGKLKKMRQALDFKISTGSLNLQQEKMIVRQINEINVKLEDALKLSRLERKKGLVSNDIEKCSDELKKIAASITDIDAKLDELYSNVKKLLGISRYKPKSQEERKRKKEIHQRPQQDINLEDIVVIKKKESKKADSENDAK